MAWSGHVQCACTGPDQQDHAELHADDAQVYTRLAPHALQQRTVNRRDAPGATAAANCALCSAGTYSSASGVSLHFHDSDRHGTLRRQHKGTS